MKGILGFVCSILFISCAVGQKKYQENSTIIINQIINKISKNKDSIYVIDWPSINDLKDSIAYANYLDNQILEIENDSLSFDQFIKDLSELNIDYKNERSYFIKQLKRLDTINKEQINSKKVRFFPFGTDPESISYDKNYLATNYFFDLKKPFFTRDGMNALIFLKDKDSFKSIIHFKKINGEWKAQLEYLFGTITID